MVISFVIALVILILPPVLLIIKLFTVNGEFENRVLSLPPWNSKSPEELFSEA